MKRPPSGTTAALRWLLGCRFDELGGLAYEHWLELRLHLAKACLEKLRYYERKEASWDNRVGGRHLPRAGMDEAQIRSGRPSDYGEQVTR
jgi:hypothetical protein